MACLPMGIGEPIYTAVLSSGQFFNEREAPVNVECDWTVGIWEIGGYHRVSEKT